MSDNKAIEFVNQQEVNKKINRLFGITGDLRPLWELFYSDILKEEKKIFQLKKPGQYADLKESTKKYKQKYSPSKSEYPILFFDGTLANSLLIRSSLNAIVDMQKDSFTYGTSVTYAHYLHGGTSRMPKRPLWFVGAEENQPQWKRFDRTVTRYVDSAIKRANTSTVTAGVK